MPHPELLKQLSLFDRQRQRRAAAARKTAAVCPCTLIAAEQPYDTAARGLLVHEMRGWPSVAAPSGQLWEHWRPAAQ